MKKAFSLLGILVITLLASSKFRAAKPSLALGGKRQGAFAFEYIIVLVIMVTVIIAGWNILGEAVMQKVNEVDQTMRGINPGEFTNPN